jgi:hypothetical protein
MLYGVNCPKFVTGATLLQLVSGNNDLLLRNEFCFSFLFLSEQADKGQLPERTYFTHVTYI